MVRESLAAYPSPEFPGAVALNYLDMLPPEEAASLLDERREKIQARLGEIDTVPADVRALHLGMEYLHRFYSGELEWLDEVVGRFATA
jgi:hypothetical protein